MYLICEEYFITISKMITKYFLPRIISNKQLNGYFKVSIPHDINHSLVPLSIA